ISFICLVECIGFEFKFGLNSIRFDLFRNRKEKEKNRKQTHNQTQLTAQPNPKRPMAHSLFPPQTWRPVLSPTRPSHSLSPLRPTLRSPARNGPACVPTSQRPRPCQLGPATQRLSSARDARY